MISEFKYIAESKLELRVSLNLGDSLFEDSTKEEISSYYDGNSTGITWKYGNRKIIFFEKGRYIRGYPTPGLDKVILIYPYDHPKYKAPQNAVIYKDDGTIYMQLKIPDLISSTAKERKSRMKNFNPMNDAYFRGVYWAKDSEGNLVTVVSIDFDWEWWESRVLNPETGEFGECVGSGRR